MSFKPSSVYNVSKFVYLVPRYLVSSSSTLWTINYPGNFFVDFKVCLKKNELILNTKASRSWVKKTLPNCGWIIQKGCVSQWSNKARGTDALAIKKYFFKI